MLMNFGNQLNINTIIKKYCLLPYVSFFIFVTAFVKAFELFVEGIRKVHIKIVLVAFLQSGFQFQFIHLLVFKYFLKS